ncbi:MAG TPA: hypothetical protein VMH49_07245 [Thermoplasmata archaeon]|nr:hypothetical protein [Thermoplasmata archaeon]
MPAMPPAEGTSELVAPSAAGGTEGQRQARYNYLVGRLRSRQITMEEATELFAAQQAMLRASEAARRVAAARSFPPAGTPSAPLAVVPPGRSPSSGGGDDLLLVGLLAMGAGAGLLAAMSRRLAEGAPAAQDPRSGGERRGT